MFRTEWYKQSRRANRRGGGGGALNISSPVPPVLIQQSRQGKRQAPAFIPRSHVDKKYTLDKRNFFLDKYLSTRPKIQKIVYLDSMT